MAYINKDSAMDCMLLNNLTYYASKKDLICPNECKGF